MGRKFDSRPCTAGLVLGWVTVCGVKPSRYVTGHLGQLSLASIPGLGKSRLGLRWGVFTCVGCQITLWSYTCKWPWVSLLFLT